MSHRNPEDKTMSYFKEFCDSIPKNKHGYVPDLLDLDNDCFRDLAMSSFLADLKGKICGRGYLECSDEFKNSIYSTYEIECQDAIDAYNQAIDDARELAKKSAETLSEMDDSTFMNLIDPNRKYTGSYRAMLDSGHRVTDF
jgi:hypothetical protein